MSGMLGGRDSVGGMLGGRDGMSGVLGGRNSMIGVLGGWNGVGGVLGGWDGMGGMLGGWDAMGGCSFSYGMPNLTTHFPSPGYMYPPFGSFASPPSPWSYGGYPQPPLHVNTPPTTVPRESGAAVAPPIFPTIGNAHTTHEQNGQHSSVPLSEVGSWCAQKNFKGEEYQALKKLGYRVGDPLENITAEMWQWAGLGPLHYARIREAVGNDH